jgi:hypothetical protein
MDRRGTYGGSVGRPEGNNHLEDTGIDGKDNIKMECQRSEMGRDGLE